MKVTSWTTWLAVLALACGTESPPPPGPVNVQATAAVQEIAVSWDPVAEGTSYNVYWSTESGVTKKNGTKVAGLTASPYQHPSLLPGTYHYVVTAVRKGGESAESAEVSADVNLVAFASSAKGTGDLSTWALAGGHTGLAAADAVCQSLATADGLVGTFVAWLSDDSADAYCRIHGLGGKKAANCGQANLPASAGPWVRRDGQPWAGTIVSITNGNRIEDVRVPLKLDETGAAPTWPVAATGSDVDGTEDPGMTCSNWTSNTAGFAGGDLMSVGGTWGANVGSLCSMNHQLICMQTGSGPALAQPTPLPGALKVFITSATGTGDLSSWAGAGAKTGVAAGDSVCQTLAAAAGLEHAGSFKAWLGSSTALPVDRLTANGPWARVDGVTFAADKAALTADKVSTALNVDEHGNYVADRTVWTGGRTKTEPSCSDWQSAGTTVVGTTGRNLKAEYGWSAAGYFPTVGCSPSCSLYCFEDSP